MNRSSRRWAERIYGLVVALYPKAFRERYGPAMRLAFQDLLQDPDISAWRIWLSVLRDLRGSLLHEHRDAYLANLNEHLATWTGVRLITRDRVPSGPLVRRGVVFGFAVLCGCAILAWITPRVFDLFSGHEISVLGGFGIVMGLIGLGIAVVGLAIAVLTRGWPPDRFGPTPPRE